MSTDATGAGNRSIPTVAAATILLLGLGISFAGYRVLSLRETRLLEAQFAVTAEHRVRDFESALRSANLGTARLFPRLSGDAAERRAQFAEFAQRRIETGTDAVAFCWAPRVSPDEISAHQQRGRDEGLVDYRVGVSPEPEARTDDAVGRLLFPVFYAEPLAQNGDLLGFNLAGVPVCAEAMRTAIETGRAASSKPFAWPTADSDRTVIALLRPLLRNRAEDDTAQTRVEKLQGFVVSVVDAEVMIDRVLGNFPDEVDMLFYYQNQNQSNELIAVYDATQQRVRFEDLDSYRNVENDRLSLSKNLQLASANWTVRCVATPQFRAARASSLPIAVLGFGLLLSAVLFGYSRTALGRNREVEQLIIQRTAELKEVSEKYANEHFLLNTLMEHSPDFIYFKDSQSRFMRISDALAKHLGFQSPDEAVGKSDSDVFSAEDSVKYLADEQIIMASGEPIVAKEEQQTDVDGNEVWISTTKSPLTTSDGETVGVFGISRDVTTRKQMEKQLAAAKDAAEEASRAKSDFLANMSHEIRTPMNAIIGMTELVLDTHLEDTQREFLTVVAESADSLLLIINQILDFSKLEAGKLELESIDFDIREEIGGTLKSIGLRAHAKEIELVWRVATSIPQWIRGDSTRLRQMLVNLVGNAIKFTSEGEVLVDIYADSIRDDEIMLHCQVSDTGIGIPAEKHRSIFSAFEQADPSTTREFGGTGLGLAITHQIATAMGGRVWLESAPGEGSTFHVTALFKQGCEQHQPQEIPDLSEYHVLIVDDNETNRKILKQTLEAWELNVVCVESAKQAISELESAVRDGRPLPLLISDVNMPEMDGFKLASHLRADPALSEIPIILLTSGGQQGDIARSEELRIAAHMIKPAKQSELLSAILVAVGRDAQPETVDPSADALDPSKQTPMRVLLAEDGIANQKMAVGMLTQWGHDVSIAMDGQQAIDLWKAGSFDLILMDVQMPVLNGLEATRQIRGLESESDKRTPIIAMTAHALKEDRQKCLDAGMDDYLSKPMRKADLALALRHVTERRLTPVGVVEPAEAADEARAESVDLIESLDAIPVIDWDAAKSNFSGNDEFFQQVCEAASEEIPGVLPQLEAAIEADDAELAHRLAHTIKGAARVVAGERTVKVAATIERDAANYDLASARRNIEPLRKVVEELVNLLRSHAAS